MKFKVMLINTFLKPINKKFLEVTSMHSKLEIGVSLHNNNKHLQLIMALPLITLRKLNRKRKKLPVCKDLKIHFFMMFRMELMTFQHKCLYKTNVQIKYNLLISEA